MAGGDLQTESVLVVRDHVVLTGIGDLTWDEGPGGLVLYVTCGAEGVR